MRKHFKSTLLLVVALVIGQVANAQIDKLTKAIQAGEEDNAIALIATSDVNALDKDGNTALASAAAFYPKITKALIDAKADINLPTKSGITPLYNACRWGNKETVKLLIDAGADVNKATDMGTALLGSFNYSSAPIVKMLLDAGAKFKEPVKLMKVVTIHPFLQYIKTVKTPSESVEYNLKNKESWLKLPVKFPDYILNPKESDFSSIADVVKVFIEKGLDVNVEYENNRIKETALDAAMQMGHVEAVKLLMDAGAKFDPEKDVRVRDRSNVAEPFFPNITYSNGDFVLAAVISNNLEFVKLMVEKYPKLVKKSYEGGGTLYCNSSIGSSAAMTNYSVKGIDLLMVAAEHGRPEIVKYLLTKGAGRGKVAEAKLFKSGTSFCPLILIRFTRGFARNSKNPEVLELIKNAGYADE